MSVYLTIAQYATLTGKNITGINVIYADFLLKKWSGQIEEITKQYFFSPNLQILDKNFRYCGDYKLEFSAFQKENLIVSVRHKKSTQYTVLIPNTDFEYKFPDFNTVVNDVIINKPVVGLDFSCYRCNCECEKVKIEGNNSWSLAIPDDIRNLLIDLLENELRVNNEIYTNLQIPANKAINEIVRDTDLTRTIQLRTDDKLLDLTRAKSALGVFHPAYLSVLAKYKLASINIYKRFSL